MSQRGGPLPETVSSAVVIDSLEFARTGGRFEGDFAVAAMGRLVETTGSNNGTLSCCVVGERDSEGLSYLLVRIVGELTLRCQRCLKNLQWPVEVDSRLMLVAPGAEWPDDDPAEDEPDAIGADKALALLTLFEDEVILALPLSPRHEICDLPAVDGEGGEPSPFAALAKLKKS